MDKTILIIDSYSNVSNLFSSSIEVYLGARVIVEEDLELSRELIVNFDPDLLIIRCEKNKRDNARAIFNFLRSNKIKKDLIVIGHTNISDYDAIAIYPDDVPVKNVIQKIANIWNITASDMASKDVGLFYGYNIDCLFVKTELVCDVFIKKDEDYILFLKKESVVHSEIIDILKNQDIKLIYVLAKERLKFINSQMVCLNEILANDKLTLDETIIFSNQAFSMIRSSAQKMQISPEIILMTESNIHVMNSIVAQIPKLKELLDLLTQSNDNIFKQSMLNCYICHNLISNLEWGTREQKIKLSFISFFHNISLPEELIFINSEDRIQEANLTEGQAKQVLLHALQSAQVIEKFKSRIPFGVDIIIKQHHGSRDGKGFTKYPHSISPLALIFMISDEFVTEYLLNEHRGIKVSKDVIIRRLKDKFKSVSYNKIFDALDQLNLNF